MQSSNTAKAITLRGIPPKTARRIKKKAEAEGISLNKAVLRLLEEGAQLPTRKERQGPKNNIARLAGRWSKEEADAFDRYLAEERRIDPAAWD